MTSRRVRSLGALCLGGSLAGITASHAAETPSPLALSCTGCHQPRVDAREMPALDHRRRYEIAAALRRFRDAPKTGSIMARFAARLSDADIESLARELGRAAPRGRPHR